MIHEIPEVPASLHVSSLMPWFVVTGRGCLFIFSSAGTIDGESSEAVDAHWDRPQTYSDSVCVLEINSWWKWWEITVQLDDLSQLVDLALSRQCRTTLSLKSVSVKKALMWTSMNQFSHFCSSVRHYMPAQPVKPMSKLYMSPALFCHWLPIGRITSGWRAASLGG